MLALDTNIFIYAAQVPPDRRKADAIAIVATASLVDCIIAYQLLGEFANACLRKGLLDLTAIRARVAEIATSFPIALPLPEDISRGLALMQTWSLAVYDAQMCATVRRAGASVLLSEDMQDGAVIDGLTVINPFAAANATLLRELLA